MESNKYIIFGASYAGDYAYKVLKNDYDIYFFADNDKNKWNKEFYGLTILSPETLINYKDYKIIIASVYYDQISAQLFLMGLDDIYVFINNSSRTEHRNSYLIERVKHHKTLKNLHIVKGEDINFINDYTSAFLEKDIKHINCDVKYGKKNILFFAYIFPPIGGSGVQRSIKFVKYLKKLGYNPIVVTSGKNFHNNSLDYTLNRDIPEDVSILRFDDEYFSIEKLSIAQLQEIINLIYGSVQNFEIMKKYLSTIEEKFYSNRKLILMPDKYIGWIISVLKNIENIIDFSKIDLMFSTSCPYSDHIAPFYIKHKTGIPWVCDLRDEWTNNPYTNPKVLYGHDIAVDLSKAMESNILNYSDMNICVTPTTVLNYISLFNLYEKKIMCIENGYDDDDFIDIKDESLGSDTFNIMYNGLFVENLREPTSFLQAINELIRENKIDRNKISIEFVGDNNRYSLRSKIERYDVFKIVKMRPYMNHIESLKNLSKAHLLLLILGSNIAKAVYSGKIFEYLRMKKRILNLAPIDSDSSKLLERAKAGETYEMNDIVNIKRYILRCYNDYIDGITYNDFDHNAIDQFNREVLTKKLVGVFDSLILNK